MKELTTKEKDLILACMSFVNDGNIGCEAVSGYNGVDDDTVWEDMANLKEKLKAWKI